MKGPVICGIDDSTVAHVTDSGDGSEQADRLVRDAAAPAHAELEAYDSRRRDPVWAGPAPGHVAMLLEAAT